MPDDYQSLIDNDRATGSQALKTSMSVANRQPADPERMARILTLAQQAKLPAGVVERNFDQVEATQKSQSTDYDAIIQDTPGLAKWLEDPHNAQLARDEVPALQRVHRGASLLSMVPDVDAAKRDAMGAVATGFSDLDAAAAHILVAFGRISPEAAAEHIAAANRTSAELNAAKPDYAKEFTAAMDRHAGDIDKAARDFSAYQGSQRRQSVLAALRGIGGPAAAVGEVVDAATTPAAPKTVGQILSLIGAAIARPRGLTYATIEQLAGSLPAMGGGMGGATAGALAGSVVPGVGTAVGSTVGMAAGTFLGAAPVSVGGAINAELQKRGVNTSDEHALLTAFSDPTLMARVRAVAERQGMTSAAVQSIFAAFAGKFTAKALEAGAGKAAVAGATAADATIQATGMAAAEQAGQAAADESTKNLSLGKAAVTGVQMLGYSLGETALGASRRALFHADPVEAAQQATVMASDALKVEHDVQALTEIGDAVKEAKATSQVPDRLKSLVEMATANNENAQVYFQSGDWDEFWQAQGASPAKAYDDIVGDGGKGYYEAKTTGSRLVIPIADYIAKVAPTDHWEGLLEHARTSVDGMSLGEAQEYLKGLPATLTDIANEAHGTKPAAEGEAAKPSIGEHVQAQLEKAGVPKAQAKAQAALYESAFATLGERAGIDPRELFDRYALDITSEKAPKEAAEATGRAVTPEEAARRANLQAAAESALERLGMREEDLTAKGTYDLAHEERDTNAKNDAGLWTYARTKAGVLRSNLKSVSTEGIVDEIARLNEANNEDSAKIFPTVSDEANVSHVSGDLVHHVSIKGEGINASGRVKQRAKSVERLESHLKERLGSEEAVQDAIASRMAERETGGFGQFYEQSPIMVGEEIPAEGKKYRPTQAAIRDLAEQKGISFEEAERRLRAAGYQQDARGRIRIGENRQISIDLLKDADRSTFIHETGHFYLEIMHDLAGQSPEIASDLGTIRSWVGAEEGANFTREQHEQFARGFEAYLMEGKAPSVALGDAFYRFKTWLVGIYRQIRSLNVDLTPDVRKVFDRLLATDEQIAAAEKAQAVEPLFDDPKAVGLSDSQAEAYSRAVGDARRTAEEEVTQRVMKEIRREESAQWKQWRAPILDAVTEEVNARPEYRALAFLKDGTNPDGSPLEEGTPTWKLERESVKSRYPDVQLPESLTELSDRGGMDPDIAAEVFGYDSGRDLVEALSKATPREKLINSLADARTVAEHGERMSDSDLRDAATKAVRGEKRAQVLRKELEILASSDMAKLKGLVRAITKPIPPTEAVRQEAAKIIGAKTVNEIRPVVYERAAKKLAAEAREALLRGDVEAAFDLKRKELLTNEVFRAATDAKESIEAALAEFKKVFGRDEKISTTRDIDLVNAARSILSSYGIGRTDKTPAEYLEQIRRYDESTYETVQAMVAAAAAQAGDYKTLSYDDFSAVRETVASLWTLARRTRQIEIDGKRIDRQLVQDELAARLAAISTPTEKPGYEKAVTNWEKTKHHLMGARAFLRRAEFWVDAVDSGKPDGVFRRYIWNPVSEATTRYRVAKRETLTKYLELVKPVEQTMKSEPIAASELGYTFRGRAELLGALLHRGNPSNLQKLLRGRHWGDFTEDHVLDRSRWDAFEQRMQQEGKLTKTDYDYVQGVWNLFEELKPASQKAHKEMYGHYFSEITAEPFQTPYGTYQGGYYPALTDNFIVTDQALRREAEAFLQGGNGFMFPTTGRGFTKSRVEAYARPLALDAATVPLGIDAVLRFTHIEPRVRDVARVIMNPDFRPHLDDFDPTIGKEMLVPWLQRAAQQRTQMPGLHAGTDKFWREVRSRTGLQILTANAIVALEQITHLPGAAVKVKPRHLAASLWRFMHSPKESAEAILEKSDYMRTRETAAVMEIQKSIDNLLLDPSKYEKVRDFAREHGNFMSRAVQHVSDVMTWNGAYEQAIERGADEQGAVREADSIVRETQGSYAPEDLSRFETSTAFLRTFSLFYSFFNAKANLLGTEFSTTARDLGLRKGAGRLLYVYALGFLVPAVMASVAKHAAQGQPLDEDDDGPMDDVFRLFFESQAEMVTRFVPGGSVASSAIGAFTKKASDDDIMVSPAVKMIEAAVHAPGDVYKAVHDRAVTSRGIKDVLTMLGLLSNLPLAPLAKPIGYAHDVSTGRAKPSGAIDRIRGSITGQHGPPHF